MARAETLAALRALGSIELDVAETLDDLLPRLADADALVLHSAPVVQARAVLDAIARTGRVRWLHFLTAGRDGFEAAGLPREIVVTHVPGASAPAVAEHALALLLALGRRLPQAVAAGEAFRWDRGALGPFSSLEGQAVAIAGAGAIGREIAVRLRAFGARPIGIARSACDDPAFDEIHPTDRLHAVLARCRALLIALPLESSTRHLIDAEALAALPPGAFVVNVARGAVLDQAALIEALTTGRLGGAALDVTDPEPPAADDPLWRCPGLLLTPHVAVDGSPATAVRIATGTAENVRRFAAGEPLQGVAAR